MFPSTNLFANIECPHKDKCGRGKLCMFKHSPVQYPKRTEIPPKKAVEKPVQPEKPQQIEPPKKAELPKQPEQPDTADHTEHKRQLEPERHTEPQKVLVKVLENKSTPSSAPTNQTSESVTPLEPSQNPKAPPETALDETIDWRQLTINYDKEGPAYDSACETTPTIPQLRAVVGDRVGYARRQKSLGILFNKYLELCDPQTLKQSPWMPAQQAVTSEHLVYINSGAGTYSSKLLVCLQELKDQQKSQ
ncbi:hypothetical protein GGI05_007456 [Coemansia sp. RSA 2603]|nr:hypothetical protein GGI05_007456 [Coemansia sp. RSA 2603]